MAVIEGNPKAAFSIATTPKSNGRCFFLLWIALLTLERFRLKVTLTQGSIKYYFKSSVLVDLRLNSGVSYIYIYTSSTYKRNKVVFLVKILL